MSKKKSQYIQEGIRLGLPIMIGYLPLGFAYGVLAVKSDMSAAWAIVTSTLVFAGAGQFIAASMIGSGASITSIIIANLMINLRHILMAAALVPLWKPLSTLQKNFLALFQTDEIFAISVNSKEPHAGRILSYSLVAQSGWVLGTAIGAFSGNMVADVRPLGLDFALSSMFIALLVPLCINRLRLLVGIIAAFCSVVCMLLGFERWSIIIGTLLGSSLGLLLTIKQEE